MMPPVVPERPPPWTTLVCFLTRLTPSTTTRCSSRSTRITLPSAPLSLPAITLTVSPFLIFIACFPWSEHLRCQRDDLHELLVAQLAPDRAEDARAAGLAVGLEDHCGVLVELDVRTVRTAALLAGAHDDSLDDVALLDVAAGDGVLDGGDDDVTDACVTTARTTENTDAQDLLGTSVVSDTKPRLLLNHYYSCRLAGSRSSWGEPGRTDSCRDAHVAPGVAAASPGARGQLGVLLSYL